MNIKILNFEPVGKGNLLAKFDLDIDEQIISGLKLYSVNQKLDIQLPQDLPDHLRPLLVNNKEKIWDLAKKSFSDNYKDYLEVIGQPIKKSPEEVAGEIMQAGGYYWECDHCGWTNFASINGGQLFV